MKECGRVFPCSCRLVVNGLIGAVVLFGLPAISSGQSTAVELQAAFESGDSTRCVEAGNIAGGFKDFAAELATPLLAVVENGGPCADNALTGLINLGPGVRNGVAADRAMPVFIKLMEAGLDSGDHIVWNDAQSALLLLGNFGDAAAPAVPVVVRVLKEREDYFERKYAVMALAEIGDGAAAAVPALLELLGPSEDDSYERKEIRYDAARALAHIPAATATSAPALVVALNSEDYSLPGIAADALAEMGEPAIPYVISELNSDDEERLERAISILSEIGPDAASAAPALVPLLASESWNVRYEAGAALRTIGTSEAAVPALIEILEDNDNADAQEAAVEVLANYGEAASPALPILRKLAKNGGWSVRNMAEDAVEMIEGGVQK